MPSCVGSECSSATGRILSRHELMEGNPVLNVSLGQSGSSLAPDKLRHTPWASARVRLSAAAVLICVLATVACSPDAIPTSPPKVARDVGTTPFTGLGSKHLRTSDDELLDLAKANPGFGGLYFDADGRLQVYLTDVSRKTAVLPAVRAFLARHGARQADVAVANAVVKQGSYDFAQLSDLYAKWNAGTPMHGITQTMIDKGRNRVQIGVIDGATAAAVAAAITQRGIDPAAVLIERSFAHIRPYDPAGLLSADCWRLEDRNTGWQLHAGRHFYRRWELDAGCRWNGILPDQLALH